MTGVKSGNLNTGNIECREPATWLSSERGVFYCEAALMNTKTAVPDQSLKILRTIHSFDPCYMVIREDVFAKETVIGTMIDGWRVRKP